MHLKRLNFKDELGSRFQSSRLLESGNDGNPDGVHKYAHDLSQKIRQTWGANLKTAKEESGVKRRAKVGEPSNKGMVNDFPLILGEHEQRTNGEKVRRTRMYVLPSRR